MINDILDFSKIEAGKLNLEIVNFSLRESLAQTIKTLTLRAQQKGLDLNLHVDPQVVDLVAGDPVRLRQIIVNLVGNAVKFTSSGAVTLSVRKESQDGKSCDGAIHGQRYRDRHSAGEAKARSFPPSPKPTIQRPASTAARAWDSPSPAG